MAHPCALLLLAACRQAAPDPERDPGADGDPGEPALAPVASWDGGAIDRDDLSTAAESDLRRLEIEYRLRRHDALDRRLRALADDRILADEAARRGISVDALLDLEVDQKSAPPADELGPSPEGTSGPAFARELRNRARSDRYDAFLAQLRKQVDLRFDLPWPELPRVDVAVAPTDPSRGPTDAPVTLVWFGDFQCPYSARVAPMLVALADAHPDVRLVWEDFPLNGHDRALPAAIAARCAGEQGHFWEMLAAVFSHQSALYDDDLARLAVGTGVALEPFRQCLDSGRPAALVDADLAAGRAAGVAATPTVFVDGITVPGARSERDFEDLVARELSRGRPGGVTSPH